MRIETISDFRKVYRAGPYAWPGGYPLYFVMGDGEALSFEAARDNRRELLHALAHGGPRDEWRPVAVEINYEDGALYCAHSGKRIPSAYAEPEETEQAEG